MAARTDVSSRSTSLLTVLSKSIRRIERAIPIPKPRIKPNNKFNAFFGEAGDVGSDAFLTIETRTADALVAVASAPPEVDE